MNSTILMVPGWTGSGPGHWMSLWEARDNLIVRVEQDDWDDPDPEAWTARLEVAVERAGPGVIVAAHSCGVSTLQRWAVAKERRIRGAFLVAPPDPELPGAAAEIVRFGPMRTTRLPFPATVVVSRTDPNCSLDRAMTFARNWRAETIDAGDAGHLNTASGHGPWPEGRAALAEFARRHAL